MKCRMQNVGVYEDGDTFDIQNPNFPNTYKALNIRSLADPVSSEYDVVTEPFVDNDWEFTNIIRHDNWINRWLDGSRTRAVQAPSYEHLAAFPVAKDAAVDYDITDHMDITTQKNLHKLADNLLPLAKNETEIASINTLRTNYALSLPYFNDLRFTRKWKMADILWPEEYIEIYRDFLTVLFGLSAHLAPDISCIPRVNPRKSVGPNNRWPDGTIYKNKTDWHYANLSTSFDVPYRRKNTGPFKLNWLQSGAMYDNLVWFYENADNCYSVDFILKALEKYAITLGSQAFRTNTPDVPRFTDGYWHTKDRPFAYEVPNGYFRSGMFDNLKFTKEVNKKLGLISALNKVRSMFPVCNASFSPPFIYMFNKLLFFPEHTPLGFPSTNENWLCSINDELSILESEGFEFVSYGFDRTNGEQFSSDNGELISKMFPVQLQQVVTALMMSILPSQYGLRVSRYLTLSGVPGTTCFNLSPGTFDHIIYDVGVLNVADGVPFNTFAPDKFIYICTHYLRAYIAFVLGEKANTHIRYKSKKYGDIVLFLRLGTDDQVGKFGSKYKFQELRNEITEQERTWLEERRLNGGISDIVTVFGLDVGHRVTVSRSLGLSKLFLFEKTKWGAEIAFKLSKRLALIPDFYETIAKWYYDCGYGSLSTFEENKFKEGLAKMGFPVEDYINIYSPVDRIIYSEDLKLAMEKSGVEGDVRKGYIYPQDEFNSIMVYIKDHILDPLFQGALEASKRFGIDLTQAV